MTFDLVIIGGGIIGAGIARDATLRGLKVCLLEKDDFGAGTTSRSTRIIHGGLRYLGKYEFGLVYEALRERRTLLRIAPHLVKPLPFLMPVYRGQGHPMPILWLAIAAYDFMSPWRSVPHHRWLPDDYCLKLEPTLRPAGLRGGFLFYDCQCLFPERLCLENVLDAAAHGADVRNHTQVINLLREGNRVVGVAARNLLTGEESTLRASVVINASGPWLDDVERLANPAEPPKLRRTKGIHLVVPRFSPHALIAETEEADRVVFAIPWGPYTLLGTTDTDYDAVNEDARAEEDDVAYLLHQVHGVLDVRLERKDILFTTAGLRPLKREDAKATADISRSHEIFDHARHGGPAGLVTVVGGKITTYRNIARDVTDYAARLLGRRGDKCRTHRLPLPGGRVRAPWPEFEESVRAECGRLAIPPRTAEYLAQHYGSRAFQVLDRVRADPRQGELLSPGHPEIRAEIGFAIEEEFARTLTDVLLRRTSMGLSEGQGRSIVLEVASEMARLLAWDAAREDAEASQYLRQLELMSVPGRPPEPLPVVPPRPAVTP